MKGQIPIVEAIIAIIALLIAFNVIIAPGEYQTKWKESLNLLKGRDILVTVDRLGKLHDYSFSQSVFDSALLNRIDAIKDSVRKVETQGTLKNTVYIACDCTSAQITYLQNIFSDVKFNTRGVTVSVCSTTLPTINKCGSSAEYPDALVIWGYKLLTQNDINALIYTINNGSSVIEIADITNSIVDGVGTDEDVAQKIIFGLKSVTGTFPSNLDEFLKPINAPQLPYQSYKWFYHLPYNLTASGSGSVPVELGIAPCASATSGNFKFRGTNHQFWICGTTSVYWDTNGNNIADTIVTPKTKFSIDNSNFFLNYIDGTSKIRISFKPDYKFNDFVVTDGSQNKLLPIDGDKNKVLLSMGFWDPTEQQPISAIIFNGTENGKAVWMANFARSGLTITGDDHKQLLASFLFSVANKKTKETLQIGQITPYINVNYTDILEIYKVELSIGTPF